METKQSTSFDLKNDLNKLCYTETYRKLYLFSNLVRSRQQQRDNQG